MQRGFMQQFVASRPGRVAVSLVRKLVLTASGHIAVCIARQTFF
jgi:hypothetical protein